MFNQLQKTDKRIHRVNMRLTDKQMKFIKKNNLSVTKIMDDALYNLISGIYKVKVNLSYILFIGLTIGIFFLSWIYFKINFYKGLSYLLIGSTLLLYQMFFNIHPFKYTLKSDKK